MGRKKAINFLIVASLLWSTGGLFIKLVDLNPLAISGLRSGIAALVMVVYLRKPKFHLTRTNLLGAIFYSALVFCFVAANKLTTSANAIFLQFTAPIWVLIFSAIFYKERPKKNDLLTIACVLGGMVLFFTGDFGTGTTAGNLIALLSGILMAGMVMLLRKSDGSAVEVTLLGNILNFIIAIPFLPRHMPDTTSILCLLALGIFQLGISYILYGLAIKHVTSIEAIIIPVIEPLLNPVWVLIFAGEKMSVFSMVGGAVIITAVVVHEFIVEKQVRKKALIENADS